MKLVFTLLLAVLLAGCAKPAAKHADNPVPPKPKSFPVPTTLFELHAAKCPQCSEPLLSPDGTENSICEKGFELMKEDFRRANASAAQSR